MKNACALLLLSWSAIVAPAFAQTNTWRVLNPTPNTFWEPLDYKTDNPVHSATLANPSGRSYSSIALGDGVLYHFGGGHQSYPCNDMVTYDIATNKWTDDPTQPECVHPACALAGPPGSFATDGYDNNPSSSGLPIAGVTKPTPSTSCLAWPYDPNCLAGVCLIGYSGGSKSEYRCAGGSRNGLLCSVDADCAVGSTWYPSTTGTGLCSVGIPTPGVPCTTCRPQAEHLYQKMAFNPVRHTYFLAALTGTSEYNLGTRAFTRLGNPPPESAGVENRIVLWDPVRLEMLWIQWGQNDRLPSGGTVFKWSYSTNQWSVWDTYLPDRNWLAPYGHWDENAHKFLVSAFGLSITPTVRWYLYDPSVKGALAWQNITNSVPVDAGMTAASELKRICGVGTCGGLDSPVQRKDAGGTWCQFSTDCVGDAACQLYPCFVGSMTYDATNQRSIVMTKDVNREARLWAMNATTNPPTWQLVTTNGTITTASPAADSGTGANNTLRYDSTTGALFLLDSGNRVWKGGPSGHVRVLKIALDLGNPLPTQTPANTTRITQTPTITPTAPPSPSMIAVSGTQTPAATAAACSKRVGPTRTYHVPSAAAAAAQAGDVICIDAGTYLGDVVHWTANNLTVIGCDAAGHCPSWTRGDWPILDPNGNSISSRGIWWVTGDTFTANSIEFKCATSIGSCTGGPRNGVVCHFQYECSPGDACNAGVCVGSKAGTACSNDSQCYSFFCTGPQPHCPGPGLFDNNDAGIRMQGHGLTVLNSYFHDNDDGILGGSDSCAGGASVGNECMVDGDCPGSTCAHSIVDIESSEFFRNGVGDGQSHNLYVSRAQQATFKYNYSHAANVGHLLKTRARINYVLYNRLTDEVPDSPTQSGPSAELDISSGGLAYVIGNVMEKAHGAVNSGKVVSFGTDPCCPLNPPMELYAVNNTMVMDCAADGTCGTGGSGTFFNLAPNSSIWAYNNIPWGANATFSLQAAPAGTLTQSNNLAVNTNPLLVNQGAYDYHLQTGSPARNAGIDQGSAHGVGLLPTMEYVYNLQSLARPAIGALDIGAFEYTGGATPIPTQTPQPASTPARPAPPTLL